MSDGPRGRGTLKDLFSPGENGTTIFLSTHASASQKRSVTASAHQKAGHRLRHDVGAAPAAAGNHGNLEAFFDLTRDQAHDNWHYNLLMIRRITAFPTLARLGKSALPAASWPAPLC